MFWVLGTYAAAAQADQADYVEGEALVMFKPGTSESNMHKSGTRHQLAALTKFEYLSKHDKRLRCHVRSNTKSTVTLIAELQNDPAVALAEPNYRRRTASLAVPNDPAFSKLWGLRNTGQSVNGVVGTAGDDIRFLDAWGMAKPSTSECVVAVLDTGIDLAHPDLAANIWTNTAEIPGDGVDDDGNGRVDDVHGYDFADNDADATDADLHGTHVAGIIAAVANNAVGTTGTAFDARIMPLKISSDGRYMDDNAILAALDYVLMMKGRGVNIVAINASYGGGDYSVMESNAIQAVGDVGIVFCAAAGNDGSNNDSYPVYPANYRLSNMLVVAASDASNNLASFSVLGSNYGTSVDLAAPGKNIYSTIPRWLGTSATLTRGATSYATTPLTYSGITAGITGTLYYCGLGNPWEFPAAVRGNIALIQRGTLLFSEKVSNAMNAGASAAVIYNNITVESTWTLGAASDWIPALAVSNADGVALKAAIPCTVTLSNIVTATSPYAYESGTSMAAPYVAAAVAFAARNFPGESASERVARIRNTVTKVASLTSMVDTGGVLNLARIVDPGGNSIPDWWENDYFGVTGINAAADPDGDGFTNLQEYLLGTQPNNSSSKFAITNAVIVQNSVAEDFRISFATVLGVTYKVEYSDSLTAGTWHQLGVDVSGTGNPASVTDNGAVTLYPRRFYRVRVTSQ